MKLSIPLAALAIITAPLSGISNAYSMNDEELLQKAQDEVYLHCMNAFGLLKPVDSKMTEDELAVGWQVLSNIKPICQEIMNRVKLVPSVEEELSNTPSLRNHDKAQ